MNQLRCRWIVWCQMESGRSIIAMLKTWIDPRKQAHPFIVFKIQFTHHVDQFTHFVHKWVNWEAECGIFQLHHIPRKWVNWIWNEVIESCANPVTSGRKPVFRLGHETVRSVLSAGRRDSEPKTKAWINIVSLVLTRRKAIFSFQLHPSQAIR